MLKGVWFLFFFGYHICPPSFLPGGRFYGFFFSLGIFVRKKKNRQPNLISVPKLRKIHTRSGLNHDFLAHGFFFRAKSRGKKKTVKLSPSYLFSRTTDSFVCDNRKIKKLFPFGLHIFDSWSTKLLKIFTATATANQNHGVIKRYFRIQPLTVILTKLRTLV